MNTRLAAASSLPTALCSTAQAVHDGQRPDAEKQQDAAVEVDQDLLIRLQRAESVLVAEWKAQVTSAHNCNAHLHLGSGARVLFSTCWHWTA